jgi:hypothetical protein
MQLQSSKLGSAKVLEFDKGLKLFLMGSRQVADEFIFHLSHYTEDGTAPRIVRLCSCCSTSEVIWFRRLTKLLFRFLRRKCCSRLLAQK